MSLSNKRFAEQDQVFQKACELAGVVPTSRQASKFRMEKGRAIHKRVSAIQELEKQDADKK